MIYHIMIVTGYGQEVSGISTSVLSWHYSHIPWNCRLLSVVLLRQLELELVAQMKRQTLNACQDEGSWYQLCLPLTLIKTFHLLHYQKIEIMLFIIQRTPGCQQGHHLQRWKSFTVMLLDSVSIDFPRFFIEHILSKRPWRASYYSANFPRPHQSHQ